MERQFEREIVTEEDYGGRLDHYLEKGWEVEKEKVIKIEESFLFWKKQRLVRVWNIRRETTPTMLIINSITLTLPKWKMLRGNISWLDFPNEVLNTKIKEAIKKGGNDTKRGGR